ncbi:hypothetical protein KY285_007879 [Solanum tuberosum]|nr:hypothetical protein KY289_008279 [Solanum tuberosum]KAH0746222.1 hypothetical protein KY285_007879 [Solanum tuberosum]
MSYRIFTSSYDSENAIKQIHVKSNERWSGPLNMPKKYMKDCFETIIKVRESIAYRYCNASISKKWATHRQSLWNEYFDPAKSKNEILSNVPCVSGNWKNSQSGKNVIETHKRRTGSFVNDEARTIGEQIELNMTQGDTNETEVSPNDIIGKMLGRKHSGRVRCMGMGASPSNTFLNTKR